MKLKRDSYLQQSEIANIKHEVLLYGAGTQSTGMLLMALNGELDSKPELAIFSDTGAEPDHIIEYKDYITKYVKEKYDFDIITVSAGDLDADIYEYLNGERNRVAQIPLYTDTGLLMRQCTQDYKIAPSDKYIKSKFGIRRKNSEQGGVIGLWMGISIDEIQRMKKSTQWWKTILYPLIESGFKREDTIEYVKSLGLEEPPRSACYFCPFHSNSYWEYLNDKFPNEYKKAIEMDDSIRSYPKLKQSGFLHKSRTPLSEVDFNKKTLFDMIDECDGYCGI